jgi:hypothetical protein
LPKYVDPLTVAFGPSWAIAAPAPSDSTATAAKARVLIEFMILAPTLRADPNHFGWPLRRGGLLGIPTPSQRKWEAAAEFIMAKLCNSLLCDAVEYD